jgi:predicted HAD superfamily Cof-like phosphohydrolase
MNVNEKDIRTRDSKFWRDSYYHRLFGLKAANEVERLLPIFEKENPADRRPREAVEAIKAWALGEQKLGMAEVRKLSLGAHAAARQVKSEAAKYVAHAAGQAVGTWHVPTHALGAFGYAGRARVASKKDKKH